MGSRSSSSTSSTNTTKDFTTNNVDNRVSEGDIGGNINLNLSDLTTNSSSEADLGAAGGGGGINTTINTSDFGALDAASELSDRAFSFSENALSVVTGSVEDSNKTVLEGFKTASAAVQGATKSALDVKKSTVQDESARTMQFALAGVALIAVAFLFKGPIARAIK